MPYQATLSGFGCGSALANAGVLASGCRITATGQAGAAAVCVLLLPKGSQLQLARTASPAAASSAVAPRYRQAGKFAAGLKAVVGSVAKRRVGGRLAAAQPHLS